MRNIRLREVLAECNKPNATFNVKYRKADGLLGEKRNCVMRNTNLNERKRMNRDGLLKIHVPSSGEMRDIFIDLLVEFNGMTIVYPPYNIE